MVVSSKQVHTMAIGFDLANNIGWFYIVSQQANRVVYCMSDDNKDLWKVEDKNTNITNSQQFNNHPHYTLVLKLNGSGFVFHRNPIENIDLVIFYLFWFDLDENKNSIVPRILETSSNSENLITSCDYYYIELTNNSDYLLLHYCKNFTTNPQSDYKRRLLFKENLPVGHIDGDSVTLVDNKQKCVYFLSYKELKDVFDRKTDSHLLKYNSLPIELYIGCNQKYNKEIDSKKCQQKLSDELVYKPPPPPPPPDTDAPNTEQLIQDEEFIMRISTVESVKKTSPFWYFLILSIVIIAVLIIGSILVHAYFKQNQLKSSKTCQIKYESYSNSNSSKSSS